MEPSGSLCPQDASTGLAESRVKAVKTTLSHMLNSTLIGTKPTLSYAELCTTLARAASIINDRPIGVRSLTEDEIVPLTVNQLLLGRSTTTSRAAYAETAQDNYMAANSYQEELLAQWWNRWKVVGLPHMIPYQRFKDAKRHKNLLKGDVCLLQYDGKFKHTHLQTLHHPRDVPQRGESCSHRQGWVSTQKAVQSWSLQARQPR